ncbi:MAG TPA: CsbD family protein [Candidatus Sulfotelmatobacter sp.]|nr:CsbD family protein [Candidatus Sulfotelmatobacter sp.]
MNEDRVKGKAKDIAGRVERQVGEWTGDTDAQAKGTMKQAEGKVQNTWGKAKDAVKPKPRRAEDDVDNSTDNEDEESAALRRKAS